MTSSAARAEPIRLSYAISDEEQRAAVRELVRAEPRVRWARFIAGLLPIVLLAWSLLAGWPIEIALLRNVFWIVLALLALTAYVPWTVRSVVRAIRRADPAWDRDQTLTIGEEGLHLESAAETTDIPSSAVRRAVETPGLVLIYIGAARVLFLPARVVALEADPADLRRVLRAKLGDRLRTRGLPD